MRVDVTPIHADVVGGQPIVLTVMITNTTTVISGFTVRVLGADPSWVTLDQAQISLFPDEVRVVPVTIVLPAGLPAGQRRIAVQVRELTPPERTSITDIELTVPPVRGLRVRTDPVVVTAGKRAGFSVLAENVGNTTILGRLAGDDPEGRVTFVFEPPVVRLAPGEHVVVDMQAEARRPLAGSPVVRPLGVFVDDIGEGFFAGPEGDAEVVAVRVADTADTNATFVQKSALSRGAFSLVGLLVAVTVFALVITLALSKLVGQNTADRDLALQVAAARNGDGAGAGTSTLMGTVKQLTTGTPLSAVSVAVFDPADTVRPLATTATAADGSWTLSQLAAGKYKLSFQRAGFTPTWYPLASNANDATTVEVKAGQRVQSLDVGLGGLPATISGTVNGDDVSAALLYLETVPGQTNAVRPNVATATPVAPAPAPPAPSAVPTDPLVGGGAIVQKEPIGSDGTFTLSNVPSPNVYQLVVVKAGYATTSQRLDVGGGETRTGVQLTLSKGDGSISGIVTDTSKALPEVTITATSGSNSVTTVSLTGAGKAGTFSLSGLPTPGSFTVTATLDGYAPQTLTLTLASGQALKGVQISLGSSAGTLAGVVTEVVHSSPSDPGHTVLSAGVTVTASDGLLSVQSQTESDSATRGNWSISGLPLPGTYTLTFSRPDLAPQTVSATLDAAGVLTNGPLRVVMQSATTSISGSGHAEVRDDVVRPGHRGRRDPDLERPHLRRHHRERPRPPGRRHVRDRRGRPRHVHAVGLGRVRGQHQLAGGDPDRRHAARRPRVDRAAGGG